MEFQHVIDQYPTFNEPLSAKYTKCFAYSTFKERIPSILQSIINYLEDPENVGKYGAKAFEVDNLITKLKDFQSSIKSDKPMKPVQMTCDFQDEQNWYNKELELRQVENEGNPPSWFQTDWLFAECYFYFKLFEIFHESEPFKTHDPFQLSKGQAISACSNSEVVFLAELWYDIKEKKDSLDENEKKKYFVFFMKCALWGNQADLSLSQGKVTAMRENMLREIHSLDHQILSDDTDKAYDILNGGTNNVIDIVLDNVGLEFHNDLIFADYLVTFGLAHKVIFHVKEIPWFVSDVTPNDFEVQIDTMGATSRTYDFKLYWRQYLREGIWSMRAEPFWVLPFDFSKMAKIDPKLYAELSKSTMVIFKGDLNYRKLVGDIYWVPTTSFRTAVRGFEPTNVLTLRTIKADTVSGLAEGIFEKLNETEPDWMRTGKYALVQVL